MKLRTTGLIGTLVLGLVVGPLPAEAQQTDKVYRIGVLQSSGVRTSSRLKAFRQALRELGYIEGQNIVIEWRFAKGKRDPLAKLAAELVRLRVDVLVTTSMRLALTAKNATRTIPIVF